MSKSSFSLPMLIPITQHGERLQAFYEETPVMMHAIDEDGRIVLVSDRWLERLGYAREDVVGRRSIEFLTEESQGRARATLDEFYRTGRVENVPYDMVASSGEIVHVLLSATSDVNDDGTFRRSMAVIQDVTDQRVAERQASALADRLRLALSASGVGIWDWDVENDVLVWDDETYLLYGVRKEDFGGAFEAWAAGLLPGTREEEEAKVARALAGEEKFDTEFRIVRPDGEIRTLRGIADVYRNEAGEPVRMLGANWDITREKAIEDDLTRLIGELRRSNEDLERFAHIASHDLREPLRGIRNFSAFLTEDYGSVLDDTAREYLSTIEKLGGRLEAYLADLLEYARLGQAEMAYQRTDLRALVTEVADTAAATRETGSVEIQVADDLPTLHCDPVKLAMVFGNLIRNGLRYNEAPVPRVWVGWRFDPGSGLHEFSVRDNGIGIDPRLQDRVFTLFRRLHARDAYGGGTGMGLTLVERAVERHGGRVWVESDGRDAGSTFRFTIQERVTVDPVAPPADRTGAPPQ